MIPLSITVATRMLSKNAHNENLNNCGAVKKTPMHFAISFHTPVIAIFGPTPPNYAVDKNRSPSLIAMRAKAVCPGSNKCTIFNSMDKERAEEIRQICNKKNQICTDMITVESVTCVAQRVLSASCFSIS